MSAHTFTAAAPPEIARALAIPEEALVLVHHTAMGDLPMYGWAATATTYLTPGFAHTAGLDRPSHANVAEALAAAGGEFRPWDGAPARGGAADPGDAETGCVLGADLVGRDQVGAPVAVACLSFIFGVRRSARVPA
jgi:hypothetical protein